MVTEPVREETLPKPPTLKVEEARINVDTPWTDDKLERQKIADRLTTVIEDQQAPFVLSLDGRWGTGKTFLLKRWQQALVNDKYQAIYFNAWEDDFCDDPLLAIIGQLTEHFQEGKLREMAAIIGDIALPILTAKLTGVAFTRKDLKRDNLLADYRTQLRTKREIGNHLTRLAAVVKEQTGKPLVFIIDELDRCRPTFAIELLERVKHIFDVPNIVFVFGINRSELVKSLESLYGEIDAGVYLRRFFDIEFILPYPDPEQFCKYIVEKYEIDSLFSRLGKEDNTGFHEEEFGTLSRTLPAILGYMGLSLRDMDYCIRLLALAGRDMQNGRTVFPAAFVLLVTTKVVNPTLYQRFVQGSARGAEVLDFMNKQHVEQGVEISSRDSRVKRTLDSVEAALYCADDTGSVLRQLKHLQDGEKPAQPEYLTKATQALDTDVLEDKRRLLALFSAVQNLSDFDLDYGETTSSLVKLIDLYDSSVRR